MEINLMEYVVDQSLILIPVLYILGRMLKNTNKIKDWCIPWILLIVGVIGAIALMGVNINAIIQGVLVTGVTVYANQLFKQSIDKREE
ncbi:Mn2+/Fe2+ NRAMP family transporter [Clostridium pascui]|uniref:phage holin family protein n=1 Tax=Clostridium pascui TaxID=46609 RepID=UPI001A9C907A|nr:phage holin family protein [Clostridium pascui]MBM7869282.1 Mn2+/Fe2+ NRAMP family transporter [Clostridium pascui]